MKRLELIDELASRIAAVCRNHPVRVAIDGVDASGKTTLADELVAPLQRMGRSVIRASIYVHADFEATVRRAEVRDRTLFGSVTNVRRRYEQRYIPGQRLCLSEVDPARRANVVIDNNVPDRPSFIQQDWQSCLAWRDQ